MLLTKPRTCMTAQKYLLLGNKKSLILLFFILPTGASSSLAKGTTQTWRRDARCSTTARRPYGGTAGVSGPQTWVPVIRTEHRLDQVC